MAQAVDFDIELAASEAVREPDQDQMVIRVALQKPQFSQTPLLSSPFSEESEEERSNPLPKRRGRPPKSQRVPEKVEERLVESFLSK